MLCYQDKTWCPKRIHRKCIHKDTCHDVLTHRHIADAVKRWKPLKGCPPIAVFTTRPKCYKELIRVKIRPA